MPVVATAAGGTEEQFPLGGLRVQCSFCLVRNALFVPRLPRGCARAARRGAGCAQTAKQCATPWRRPPQNALRRALRAAFSFRRPRPLVSFRRADLLGTDEFKALHAAEDLAGVAEAERSRWEALIVQTDATPLPGLYQLLAEFLDARLRPIVFEDAPATSSGGYEVTDRALALARAKWLIVTNGDNIYDASFLDSLSSSSDLVAFDFYSRHVGAMDMPI